MIGGHTFQLHHTKKFDLKIKNLIFSLIFSFFNCFHFILHTAIFLRKVRSILKVSESRIAKTQVSRVNKCKTKKERQTTKQGKTKITAIYLRSAYRFAAIKWTQ